MDKIKLCLVFHFGDVDEWEFYEPYLKNVPKPYDLFVTIHDRAENTEEKIKEYEQMFIKSLEANQTTMIKVPNKGADCGAFLLAIDYIIKNSLHYDYVLKIHTKTTKNPIAKRIKPKWREELITVLLSSREQAEYCLDLFSKEPDTGLIGPKSCYWDEPCISEIVELIKSKFFGDFNSATIQFIGGTMFFARLDIYVKQLGSFDLCKIVEEIPEGFSSIIVGQSHAIERLLGYVITRAGYSIKCV